MNGKPASAPQSPDRPVFPVIGGELAFGGIPLSRLRDRVGGTPFYAYDRTLVAGRIRALRAILPPTLALHYAVKANPFPELVNWMATEVDGFDIASPGELDRALASGMPPAAIGYAAPGKRQDALLAAAQAGVCIHVESIGEARRLAEIQRQVQRRFPVLLRLNPDFELRKAGMKMGGSAGPFGVDVEQAPAVLAELGASGLDFAGFHIYAGSQSLDGQAVAESFRMGWDTVGRLAPLAPAAIRLVNLGGGFGIPYFAGQGEIDLSLPAAALRDIVADAGRRMPGVRVVIELGRYLVGEAGIYVASVIDRKVSRGRTFLVTDGGMNHHLAASGNLGQVLRKNYPVLIGTRADRPREENVTVVGPLCTPLDVIADRVDLPFAEPGDLVVVLMSGAYGASASPQGFLSHPPVREILV